MIVMLGAASKDFSRASSFENPDNDCHARCYSEGQQPGIFVLAEWVPSPESL
jgi:hypothetical protein